MPSFLEFVSELVLVGVLFALPVCIVGSVVRAIVATGHRDQPVR